MLPVLPQSRSPCVAPHAGAWIEIPSRGVDGQNINVAPHAGAWIEIPPQREIEEELRVAPHAGAWIEMMRL